MAVTTRPFSDRRKPARAGRRGAGRRTRGTLRRRPRRSCQTPRARRHPRAGPVPAAAGDDAPLPRCGAASGRTRSGAQLPQLPRHGSRDMRSDMGEHWADGRLRVGPLPEPQRPDRHAEPRVPVLRADPAAKPEPDRRTPDTELGRHDVGVPLQVDRDGQRPGTGGRCTGSRTPATTRPASGPRLSRPAARRAAPRPLTGAALAARWGIRVLGPPAGGLHRAERH